MSAKMAVKAEAMAPTVLGSNPAEAGVAPIVLWTDSRAFMFSFSCVFRGAGGQASDMSFGARLYREISMSDPPISIDIRRNGGTRARAPRAPPRGGATLWGGLA